MSVRIVRLGTPRDPDEGLRIGTVRRPPRGVHKADYAARDYFDVWLPIWLQARRSCRGRYPSRSRHSAGLSISGGIGER